MLHPSKLKKKRVLLHSSNNYLLLVPTANSCEKVSTDLRETKVLEQGIVKDLKACRGLTTIPL